MTRVVKVGTTALGYYTDVQEGCRRALELVNACGQSGCDLALLPENLYSPSNELPDRADLQRMQGQLCEIASRYHMYVIAGLPVWEGDRLFNCAVLFDRAGEIAGLYKKIHPTEGEVRKGITPGSDLPVFDLDFGRVGALICFDIGWPQEWARLGEMGAEIVVWLSAYDGGFPLQAYAWTHKYYVVSSVRSTEAKFIDITGTILGGTSRWTRLAIAELNLERKLFHIDQNWDKLVAVQARYGSSILIRGFSEENFFTIEPQDDAVTVDQIISEYGLEPYREYHARVTAIQDEARMRSRSV